MRRLAISTYLPGIPISACQGFDLTTRSHPDHANPLSRALGFRMNQPLFPSRTRILDEPEDIIIDEILIEHDWDMPNLQIRHIRYGGLGSWFIKQFRKSPVLALGMAHRGRALMKRY